jgi:beta-lactamase superfamily II metal-dependent hydrolase
MARIHFLNVNEGDCSIIQHNTDRVTVIDVCNAKPSQALVEKITKIAAMSEKGLLGNFSQKKYPVNPVSYMRERGISEVHRFILTHPDMDHMDGIEMFFGEFSPLNFWDTDNQETKEFKADSNTGYNEDDWKFYKNLRDRRPEKNPRRLALLAGQYGVFWNRNEAGERGDGIQILAPTEELMRTANESGDYNDSSYVLLYRTGDFRVLFAGDSHDKTWEHILSCNKADVAGIDLLIAPHHGRDSGRSFEFLDILNPKLTLFGNAESEALAYSAWNNRGLHKITNNQAGCVIAEIENNVMYLYVSCEGFARSFNPQTTASSDHPDFHYYGCIDKRPSQA